MQHLLKSFGMSVVGLVVCTFVGNSYAAATGRAAYNNVQSGRAGVTTSASSQRMPEVSRWSALVLWAWRP